MLDINQPEKLLLFGGSGAIGSATAQYFREKGWRVIIVSRQEQSVADQICWDPLWRDHDQGLEQVAASGPYDAVCWAQGANLNDSIYSFDLESHEQLYRANVLFVLESMRALLQRSALKKPARLCVISSIWQNLARQNKLSYCVTKSALQGLVLSAANDLGGEGHLFNAVLPGVIDTPMTRKNLSSEQINKVIDSTQFGRLPSLDDVASSVYSLCSKLNTGLTGQFVTVDLGYSHVRVI